MTEKVFTGVFIPAKIWEDRTLIPAEKMILGEIKALSEKTGWCTAKNGHFAEWLGCKTANVSMYLTKLAKSGYIEAEYANQKTGEGRKMRVNLAWYYGTQDATAPFNQAEPPSITLNPPFNHIEPPFNGIETEIQYKLISSSSKNARAEKFPLEALPPSPPVPAAPPSPGPAIDAARAVEIVKANPMVPELMQRSRRVPADLFERYLGLWELEIKGRGITYWKQSDAIDHFLNFAASKHRHEKKEAPAQASPQRLSNDDVYRNFNRVQF